MSEYMFGVGRAPIGAALAKRIDRIANRHGASLVTHRAPGSDVRYWFTAPNEGAPFDAATRRAVMTDLAAAGIVLP